MSASHNSSSPEEHYPSRGLSPGPNAANGSKGHDSEQSKSALPVEKDVMQLARLGEIAAIQKLFTSGEADAHAKDEQGITPLHWAAFKNHYALCHFLIQSGADVNAKGGDLNATPILWAARNCHYYIVDLLLQHGADPLRTDDQGFNLIQNAALDGNVYQVVLILYHDVAVDTPDPSGHTALMWAAYKGFPACVEVLLRLGASVSATDEQGFTALHWALVKGSYGCIQKLIEYGADRFVANNDGKTPSVVAEEMSTKRTWQKALEDCGYKSDATPHKFPLSSIISDQRLFISRFLFLWPFVIIYCDIYIISGMPIYAGIPIAIVAFFALHWAGQQLLQWAPPNMKKMDRTPFLAGIFAGSLFWVGITWLFRILPVTFFLRPLSNLLFGFLYSLCTYFYGMTMLEDPGFISKNGSRTEQKAALKEVIEADLFDEAHFCIECMVRKPLRSKHCRRCGRCVAKEDHHCPWVNNCVGINNHRHFVLYILTLEVGVAFIISLTYTYIRALPSTSTSHCNIIDDELCQTLNKDSFTITLMIWTALQLTWVTMLIFVQVLQISRAQTTYENMRGHGKMSGPAEVMTSAALAGTTSLDDAELAGRPRGLDASAQTRDRPPRKVGCWEQWKKLLGVDAFVATAAQQTRGAEVRARQRMNPYTRGIVTNCKDFFCDPAPLFAQRENGTAMLGGEVVNYTRMYETPLRRSGRSGQEGGSYTAVRDNDDSV